MNRWFYVLICGLINVCIGNVYAWSVFRKPAEKFFSITSKESGLPFMIFLAFFAVSMPLTGKFLDKYSPRFFALVGGTVFSIGYILSGFMENIQQVVLTYGVISGLGVGVIYGTTIAVPAKWVPERKGLAVGLSILGFGVSPLITSYLSHSMIESYGLMNTFKILGLVYMVIILILSTFLKFPNDTQQQALAQQLDSSSISPREIVKGKYFYALWICFFIGAFTGLSTISISSPFLIESTGIAAGEAALYVSFLAIFNGLGRPFFGFLTDKIGFPKSILVSYFVIILSSIILFLNFNHLIFLYVLALALLWSSLGGWLAIAPTATASLFGTKYYSSNYGLIFTAYGTSALLGVYLSSSIRDLFGQYLSFFYPVIGLCILGILISLFTFKK